jgi:DnaJ-class molecular chaperone
MHDIPLFSTIKQMVKYICKSEEDLINKIENKCDRCNGCGYKESNGYPYKCNMCDGLGYVKKKNKK